MSELVKLEGLEETTRNMLKFNTRFDKNVVAISLRKGANIIKAQAIENAPHDPSPDGVHIKKDIKVRRDPRPQSQGMTEIMYVKPYGKKGNRKWGKKRIKSTRQYWHIVEFGSIKHKGKRYMTRAWESKKIEAHNAILNDLKKQVEKQVTRIKK